MARSYSIATLMTRARERADMDGGNTYVEEAELQRLVDVAYAELVDLLARHSIHQFETSTEFVSDGTNDYAVPSDHYKTLGLDYKYAASQYVKVEQLMFEERNRYSLGINGSARGYRLVGSNIILYPTPPSGQTYKHTYIPAPADISAVATSTMVDGVAGWEEYIVIHVAKNLRIKEESSSVIELDNDLTKMTARIEEMAQDRQPPMRIVDVEEEMPNWDPASRWGYYW